MKREIKLEISETVNQLGKAFLFAGFLLGALSAVTYIKFPPSAIYFIIPGIIAILGGIILYTGWNTHYIIKPVNGEVFCHRIRLYSKSEEKITFDEIKVIELYGKKEPVMNRRSRRLTHSLCYQWHINLITDDGRKLRITDTVSGDRSGPYGEIEEEAKKISEIIGCSAVIAGSHIPVNKEIYNPEKLSKVSSENFSSSNYNFEEPISDFIDPVSNFGEPDIMSPQNPLSAGVTIKLFLFSSLFFLGGIFFGWGLVREWIYNFDIAVLIMSFLDLTMILVGLVGYYATFIPYFRKKKE